MNEDAVEITMPDHSTIWASTLAEADDALENFRPFMTNAKAPLRGPLKDAVEALPEAKRVYEAFRNAVNVRNNMALKSDVDRMLALFESAYDVLDVMHGQQALS